MNPNTTSLHCSQAASDDPAVDRKPEHFSGPASIPTGRFQRAPGSRPPELGQPDPLRQLRDRLLATQTASSPSPEQAALAMHAAREAEAIAWTTAYPLLFLPTLLEEHIARALSRRQVDSPLPLGSNDGISLAA